MSLRTCSPRILPGHLTLPLALALLLGMLDSAAASEQPPGSPVAADAQSAAVDEELYTLDAAQLRIRVAPLTVEQLVAMKAVAMQALQDNAEALAKALIEQLRLSAAAEPDSGAIVAVKERIATLTGQKADLVSRTNVVLASLELKGGDVAAAQAYITAVATLVSEDDEGGPATSADAEAAREALVHARVAELVAVVRAEPPTHERQQPWTVPLSEFELELQPLPVESILERLEKWREILQREVRKRVRIDILLSDAEKLEATRAVRAAAHEADGLAHEEVDLAAIKSRLAERSQEQQAIINQIVRRMEVAILLVTRRGGDTAPYTKYIAAATGQKLNLTDPSVLRAQVMAWLRSPRRWRAHRAQHLQVRRHRLHLLAAEPAARGHHRRRRQACSQRVEPARSGAGGYRSARHRDRGPGGRCRACSASTSVRCWR